MRNLDARVLVESYIPPRMVNQRRHMYQDVMMLIGVIGREAQRNMAEELASQPLWKRIWVAITKDY